MTERSEAQEIVLRSRGILPVVLDGEDPGRSVTGFLRELLKAVRTARRKAPAKN